MKSEYRTNLTAVHTLLVTVNFVRALNPSHVYSALQPDVAQQTCMGVQPDADNPT
jgi:hypothetical protein